MGKGREIQAWLNGHPQVKEYVILDDVPQFFGELVTHHISVDSIVGITSENTGKAIKMKETKPGTYCNARTSCCLVVTVIVASAVTTHKSTKQRIVEIRAQQVKGNVIMLIAHTVDDSGIKNIVICKDKSFLQRQRQLQALFRDGANRFPIITVGWPKWNSTIIKVNPSPVTRYRAKRGWPIVIVST